MHPPTQGGGRPSSSISMYVNNKTSLLMQTCIALASNPTSVQPQEKHRVRIIMNSGSQKTYITQKLKENLGLKQMARERLCMKTFGSDYNNLKTVDVVNLCMKNVDNDVTVTVTAHVVPIICSPLDYQAVQFARKKSCSFEGHCFVGTYFRRESRRRHSHWSRSAVEHCKWKGQKRRELACCNEHMIWMDIIWSCRECTSLRYSLSQYGGNTRTSD